jgi:RimJ/RimL family protein N-acetyltransferase
MKQTLLQLLGKEIKTERLILKKMTAKDTDLLWKIFKEKGSTWYFPDWSARPTRKDIKNDLRHRYYQYCFYIDVRSEKFSDINEELHRGYYHYYAIIHKKSRKFLGFLYVEAYWDYDPRCRHFYMSYFLHQKYEKNGYMTESVRAVCEKMRYCRTPYRITLTINSKNKKSLRVAQKCGFNWKDTCFVNYYSLIPPRYKKPFYSEYEEVDWDNLTNVA